MNELFLRLASRFDPATGWVAPWVVQTSLFIACVFLLDWTLRRRVRATARYFLWIAVLVKLVLPPTFALPSSPAWWLLHPSTSNSRVATTSGRVRLVPASNPNPAMMQAMPAKSVTFRTFVPALLAAIAGSGSLVLLTLMATRWCRYARLVSRAAAAPGELQRSAAAISRLIGLSVNVPVRVTKGLGSPAVIGFVRPAILIPEAVCGGMGPDRLRTVLLHELLHIRRRDPCINAVQALLQATFWWHPLVWVANWRMRQVREEAVDESVLYWLGDSSEDYAPTLLEVARLSLARPFAGLGMIGILERSGILRGRILRVVAVGRPSRPGAGAGAILAFILVGLCLIPMAGRSVAEPPLPANDGDAVVGEISALQISTKSPVSLFLDEPSKEMMVEARALYEAGKLEEAQAKLEAVLKSNPRAAIAHHYMNLIHEARFDEARGQGVRMGTQASDSSRSSIAGTRKSKPAAARPPGELQPITRVFKLDPGILREQLQNLTASAIAEDEVGIRLKELIEGMGGAGFPPNSMYYKSQQGTLMVRAPRTDMAAIEALLQELNTRPPQLLISGIFIAVSKQTAAEFMARSVKQTTPGGHLSEATVLTEQAATDTLAWLRSQAGTEILSMPRITTLSGRQCSIETSENTDLKGATNVLVNGKLQSGSFPRGPGMGLEVFAYARENEPEIQLTVSASVTEFMGYDDAGQFTRLNEGQTRAPASGSVPLPHFSVRTVGPKAFVVWDGQTIVVPGLKESASVGKRASAGEPREVLVFVKPVQVDPAGKRLLAPQ